MAAPATMGDARMRLHSSAVKFVFPAMLNLPVSTLQTLAR
jgi:hypothetical protein